MRSGSMPSTPPASPRGAGGDLALGAGPDREQHRTLADHATALPGGDGLRDLGGGGGDEHRAGHAVVGPAAVEQLLADLVGADAPGQTGPVAGVLLGGDGAGLPWGVRANQVRQELLHRGWPDDGVPGSVLVTAATAEIAEAIAAALLGGGARRARDQGERDGERHHGAEDARHRSTVSSTARVPASDAHEISG